jgi:hypothetical protein
MLKKGKWDEFVEFEAQDPKDMMEFSAEYLTWTHVYGDQVAVIPYSQFEDFISGEQLTQNVPTEFVFSKQ